MDYFHSGVVEIDFSYFLSKVDQQDRIGVQMQDSKIVRESHLQHFSVEPFLFSAPGRVNIIGEHTDYAEGFVMPAAIDFTTVAGISRRTDGRIVLHSLHFAEEVSFDLANLPAKGTHHWSDYPMSVVSVLKSVGVEPVAFSLTFAGDIPLG